jgi:hypothetical protein
MGASLAGSTTRAEPAVPTRSSRTRRCLAASAGPTLIVACVVFALRGFVFQDRLTQAHPDILTFWLPRFAFLGRSIASGHLPLWNPFEMAGYRFAADPQGGWLYLAPMGLFSTLSPAVAMRAFIVLNPVLAGLGLFGFLRIERLSRAAATAGGLSLAMLMATSEIAVSMPFAGSIAWTTVTMIGAAGYRRSTRWPRRIGWLALGALGWSQVATAHLSHGLVMCTGLTLAYLVAGGVTDVRRGSLGGWVAAVRTALFLVTLPLASLAVLIPRIDALRASSLAAGYDRLGDALGALGSGAAAPIQSNGVWAAWPLGFAVVPGAYAGAVILLAVPLALRARRHRTLLWAFGGALVLSWIGMLDAVVRTSWVRTALLKVPFGDVYLHNPGRLRYVAAIAIPVVGAIGIQGLRDDPMPASRVARWLGAGAALWVVLPLVARAHPLRFVYVAVMVAAAGWALWLLATRRRTWAWAAVIGVLAIELVGSSVWSQLTSLGDTIRTGLESGEHENLIPQPLPYPEVDAAAFAAPTAFVPRLRSEGERFLTWAPPAAYFEKGYLFMQLAPDWPALSMERGSLFGVRDVLGYNPVQLPRYWSYIRARSRLPMFYNASVIDLPAPRDIRLLGVRYLVIPTGVAPPLPGEVVDRAQGYDLVELDDREPLVSVVSRWEVAPSTDAALRRVLPLGFDPAREAVLERDPGITMRPQVLPGTVTITRQSAQDLSMQVDAHGSSIVVVRTSFDDGWTATVDGVPAPVLPVDGFLQGIPVEAGSHEVRLTYGDDAITAGIVAGLLVWSGMLLAFGLSWGLGRARRRRRAAAPVPPPAADASAP